MDQKMKGGGRCGDMLRMAAYGNLRFEIFFIFFFLLSHIFWRLDCAEGVKIYVCDSLSNIYNLKLISQFCTYSRGVYLRRISAGAPTLGKIWKILLEKSRLWMIGFKEGEF